MTLPAVSILMSVRNEEDFLPAALESIARQTMPAWELVAVNDGSTDGTGTILDAFARKEPRCRVIHQSAFGLVPALNKGLESCSAPLVARMDGDDISHPLRLEKQLEYLHSDPALTVVGCDIRHFPSRRVMGGMRHYESWQNTLHAHEDISRNLFVESPFAQPSVTFRASDVKRAGGYRDMGWAEDYDLWLRLAGQGARFARIPKVLFYWREHERRLTRTGAHCTLDAFRRCKVHFLSRGYLQGQKRVTLWGAGMEGKAWRKRLMEQGIIVRRWIDIDPNKVGQSIHCAPVDEPDSLRPNEGPMLITIGARGARDMVRDKCRRLGLAEGEDYVCVT